MIFSVGNDSSRLTTELQPCEQGEQDRIRKWEGGISAAQQADLTQQQLLV